MFFDFEHGMELKVFGIYHNLMLLFMIGIIALIYIYRLKIRNYKYEKRIRYGIAGTAILAELSLYIWIVSHGEWVWLSDIPFGALCGLTLYIGIIAMFSKSYKLFEIGFFWTFGALASLLFPDILHSVDRFRFYQFMLNHGLMFIMFVYMLMVLNFIPTFKSLLRSAGVLLSIVIIYLVLHPIIDVNYLFLVESEGTPFEIFEGGSQFFYVIGVMLSAILFMSIWFGLGRLYKKMSKSDEYRPLNK